MNRLRPLMLMLMCAALLCRSDSADLFADGGSLTISVIDETTGQPTISRMELFRADAPNKRIPLRRTVPAGIGVVLDRKLTVTLPEATYQFRMIRGPEYRIISGRFSLERTSLDEHTIALPRMIDMLEAGWTSGDCAILPSPNSLPLRMAAEDLHVAAGLGAVASRPIPGRDKNDPIDHGPIWIRDDARHHDGLIVYGQTTESATEGAEENTKALPSDILVLAASEPDLRVAIENPFAWPLPVWLASGQIDGMFVLGDWLRLDRPVTRISDGRPPVGPSMGGKQAIGRYAERVYWNALEAGIRLPPLAGCGDQGKTTPVGYNRLYVAEPADAYQQQEDPLVVRRVMTKEQFWQAVWQGHSVATNGPLMRPMLGGKLPGHVFKATDGEALKLTPEVTLTTRDPVEYLEVVHNGRVHYSARLDEFAKAGGTIPPLVAKESGWVTIRVVTLFEDHFRAALSAPWYIEFDGQPRVTAAAVTFFRDWLSDYEKRLKTLPAEQLRSHVPYIRAARSFWQRKAEIAIP